jgi:acyl transferase domain-containing protein
LADKLADPHPGETRGPHRLAIVATDPDDLRRKAGQAASQLRTSDAPAFNFANSIIYRCTEGRSRTALLFPGFGAHHPSMFQDLAAALPEIVEWASALDRETEGIVGCNPILFPAKASDANGDAASRFACNLNAVVLMDLAVYRLLHSRIPDFACDAMLGHSYGETAMLVASGMTASTAAVLGFLDSLVKSIPANTGPRGMLAVTAKRSRSLLDGGSPSPFSLALDNCPKQAVLCGPLEDVARVERELKLAGDVCFRLHDLTLPVHTREFPIPPAVLENLYAALELRAPRVPCYSCSTTGVMRDEPPELARLLAAQWSCAVRFQETIERMYADGIRCFVEAGPGGRLQGFVRDTLRGRNVQVFAANLEQRDTLHQLQVLLGQLFAEGFAVRPLLPPPETIPPVTSCTSSGAGQPKVRRSGLLQQVLDQMAAILGLATAASLDPQRGFFEAGLSSLDTIELAERMGRATGVHLPQSTAFDYPTPEALAAYLSGETAEPAITGCSPTPASNGAVAITGMACRFPGKSNSPEFFWEFLRAGGCAIGPVPPDRWTEDHIRGFGHNPAALPGIMRGAFLDEIQCFDHELFGFSARETITMDPQQRLLLELAWEALEDAGLNPWGLRGRRVGVFTAIGNSDYASRLTPEQRLAVGGYLGTGNQHSTAAGRLSFVFGFEGPSVAVETACSSSLVAVHLARQSLLRGECDLAIVAGANLILSPETSIGLALACALSPTGTSQAFDAAADGYVRGEGCAAVVLQHASSAREDGHRIRALVCGSAVNHAGHTSALTVPSGPAQQALIRTALAGAGVAPDLIGYIEAHGTGTPLGDPIEARALGQIFREGQGPLPIGTVKTNIGHLEACAGLAGLIKTVLQLEHREVVPSLGSGTLTPRIDWSETRLDVARQARPWLPIQSRYLAGVSSFGISGTNAHVVLEGVPEPERPPSQDRPFGVLTLSGGTPGGIEDLRKRYAGLLATASPNSFADICYTAQVGRAPMRHRIAVVASGPHEALQQLEATGPVASARRSKLAFVFTGQGAQYAGMGAELYRSETVFQEAFDRCAALFSPFLKLRLQELVIGNAEDGAAIHRTGNAQPALFALEYALAELWRGWGIEPDAVVGHSLGEFVAAVVAGVMRLEDAVRLVAHRARLMQGITAAGAMAAVDLPEDELRRVLLANGLGVSIAAVNEPASTVVSGDQSEIEALEKSLRARGIRSTSLRVSHAFHSALMDPVTEDFRAVARSIEYAPPKLPLALNLTSEFAQRSSIDADYWTQQLRRTVRFDGCVNALASIGCGVFLELGPKPVLSAFIARRNGAWLIIPSLVPSRNDQRQVLECLAALYQAGWNPDWTSFHKGHTHRRVPLPSYPFQRETFWLVPPEMSGGAGVGKSAAPPGRLLDLPGAGGEWRYEFQPRVLGTPWLSGYQVSGQHPVCLGGLLSLLWLAIGKAGAHTPQVCMESCVFGAPLMLDDTQFVKIQTLVQASGPGRWRVRIFSRDTSKNSHGEWAVHADGSFGEGGVPAPMEFALVDAQHFDRSAFYSMARFAGIEYGPSFQVTDDVWVALEGVQAALTIPDGSPMERLTAILESAVQVLGAWTHRNGLARVVSFGRTWLAPELPVPLRLQVTAIPCEDNSRSCRIAARDAESRIFLSIEAVRWEQLTGSAAIPRTRNATEILEKLALAEPERRYRMTEIYLGKLLSKILGSPTVMPNADVSMNRLGLDSLMAVQLRNRLIEDFCFDAPASRLTSGLSLAGLAGQILEHAMAGAATASEVPAWTEGEL